MSAKKTERLLNLVICLLHTRRHLSVQEIRELVPGYDQGSEDAFRRMFERDKEELRDLGIPLETGTDTAAHDDELGYRIARRDYELPPISLEPDEAAALGLAARLWQSAPLAGATGSALLKLRAAGVDAPDSGGALEPRVGAGEPAFEACLAAVTEGRSLLFDYRASGRPTPEQRRVDPWGVVWWHGRWYVVGHDTARADVRVFRLSRIVGAATAVGEAGTVQVPAETDLRALVARTAGEEPSRSASVRVRAGAAWALRREATSVTPDGEGWDRLEVGYSDPERFADRVTGYAADVVVRGPEEAREAVVRRLAALTEEPVS
ncbi:MAG: WYL domain-containing protein [Frankiaceae bacterium]|nr:WYL domain-containing protein [Frankiaceae bacterium]